jgi:leader peptidase (prepilin peptidase)/N-methyltransferase
MIPELIPVYILIFLFGIVIGSFLNVCIFRIPKHETVVTERSHCMSCGYQLSWYDMVPVFSWLFLRGRCRKCRQPISPQYPIIEVANGAAYVLVFAVNGFSLQSILFCFLMSALIVLAIIDWRTYEIPIGINIFILCLGILRVLLDYKNWMDYAAGFLCVSIFLYLLLVISKGRAIGGGDVKLMASAGLLLGWKNIILAFLLGCIIGSVIHLLRMKISGADHVLAMGPYLAIGIAVAALWGDTMIAWYFSFLL